jgi:hypothetical protein
MPSEGQIFECYTSANDDETFMIASTGNGKCIWQKFASGNFNDADMYAEDTLTNINKLRPSSCHYCHVKYENGKYTNMPYMSIPLISGDGTVNIPKTNKFTYLLDTTSGNNDEKEWMILVRKEVVYTIFRNAQTDFNFVLYTKEYNSNAEAKAYMQKKLNEKTKKGYEDKGVIKATYEAIDNTLSFS